MSLAKLLNQQLTLISTGSTVDEYGDSILTGGTSTSIVGYLEQSMTDEAQVDRDTITQEWECYLPADTSVTGYDRIGFNGQTFQIIGAPWSVHNPRTGAVSHIKLKLKVAE